MYPKYALKIRKSDLALLALLNGGQEPEIEKGATYLIVDTDPEGHNNIITEKEWNTMRVSLSGPVLFKLTNTK